MLTILIASVKPQLQDELSWAGVGQQLPLASQSWSLELLQRHWSNQALKQAEGFQSSHNTTSLALTTKHPSKVKTHDSPMASNQTFSQCRHLKCTLHLDYKLNLHLGWVSYSIATYMHMWLGDLPFRNLCPTNSQTTKHAAKS